MLFNFSIINPMYSAHLNEWRKHQASGFVLFFTNTSKPMVLYHTRHVTGNTPGFTGHRLGSRLGFFVGSFAFGQQICFPPSHVNSRTNISLMSYTHRLDAAPATNRFFTTSQLVFK
eukprot:TRINITY_DN10440_c0_g1_i1.p1 TRINITY_DN10440_c0_g1~~TRINITY_DN10440_c0_g1_i1.p1  ORF type:complete len:116 (+),score=3.18 TRINITY_DN10440_c0_g1_i1:223-570(+)